MAEKLKDIVIFDVDGTLALMSKRSPYQWKRVGEDSPNKPVIDLAKKYSRDEIIVVSGRDSICRQETLDWLNANDVPFFELYMRPEGNKEPDTLIKQRIYDDYIKDKYNVTFVVDDRPRVCRMWRSLGLTVFQVNDIEF